MQTPSKLVVLPFASQKTSGTTYPADVEAAAVFAVAEFEREKGGGLILKQPEEQIAFLSKVHYPIWLFPNGEAALAFDGLKTGGFGVSYVEVPSSRVLAERLQASLITKEDYVGFLSWSGGFFQVDFKEKNLFFPALVAQQDFKDEFAIYVKQADVTVPENPLLLSPAIDQAAIVPIVMDIAKLQSTFHDEQTLVIECLKKVKATTSQYVQEIGFSAEAAEDEANAKIKAQAEIVNPQISTIKNDHKKRVRTITVAFEAKVEHLRKQKAKTQKYLASDEKKIKHYQQQAKEQAAKNHHAYEQRYKQKSRQLEKELDDLKKALGNIEEEIGRLTKQHGAEILKLTAQQDEAIKLAREPIVKLEASRDAKQLAFKQEVESLLGLEKPVVEGLNRALKLLQGNIAKFDSLGMVGAQLDYPLLYYVPFYVAHFKVGSKSRFIVIPPSNVSQLDLSAKLKGVLGMGKIRDVFSARYKAVAALIGNVPKITQQNPALHMQIVALCEKNSLLDDSQYRSAALRGLVYLKREGWLSEKEQQLLSESLGRF